MSARSKKATRASTVTTTTTTSSVSSNAAHASGGDSVLLGDEEVDNNSFGSTASGRLTRTRFEEKQTLSGLNDRLAGYIEKVRQLEDENRRLTVQIRDVEIVERRERDNANNEFKQKIEELRALLDDASRLRTRADVDRKKFANDADEFKKRAEKAEKELSYVTTERDRLQERTNSLSSTLSNSDNKRSKLENEVSQLRKDLEEALQTVAALRAQIEDEFMIRDELQSKNAALLEDMEMNKNSYENELSEMYHKREIEMNTVGREYETRYENQLKLRVKEMRAEFDARLRDSRQEVDDKYRVLLDDANNGADYHRQQAIELREQLAAKTRLVKDLEKENGDYKLREDSLLRQIRDLESRLRMTEEKVHARDEQIAKLQTDIDRMLREYQDLMDVKVQLDNELQTYHELLQSEETRLRINTPNTSQEDVHVTFADETASRSNISTSASRRPAKRRRLEEENIFDSSFEHRSESYRSHSEAKGDLVIDFVDPEGTFIRLMNKGPDDIPLGGVTIVSQDVQHEVKFKFNTRLTIKAGKKVTVYSANSGETAHPPTILVLKNQSWPKGAERRTIVLNSNGDELALSEKYKETSERQLNEGDERCSLM